jgi:TPR repeat protein
VVTRLISYNRFKQIKPIEWLVVLAIIGFLAALFIPPVQSTCGPRRVTIRDLSDILRYRTQNVDHANIQKYIEEKGKNNRFEIWKKTAEEGVPHGQVLYGLCFFYGAGVPQDKKEAMEWFVKALMQGHELPADLFLEMEEENKPDEN